MKLATVVTATRTIASPIGPLRIEARRGALVRLEMLAPPSEDELALWDAMPDDPPPAKGVRATRATKAAKGTKVLPGLKPRPTRRTHWSLVPGPAGP